MNKEKALKALIVDDEKVVRDFLSRFLKLEGVETRQADGASGAMDIMGAEKIDIVFIDIRMPSMNGLDLFRELKKMNPGASYIMMTGYSVDDMLAKAEEEGAMASLKKPFELNDVEKIIGQVKRSLRKDRADA